MAKVKFTSIVSEIRGKLRGDVFKGYKQGFSLQNKANPPFSNTQRQSDTRALLVYLTGIFAALTEEEQSLWQIYGSVLIPPISARNAYVKLNLPILAAPDSGYTIRLAPPPEPLVVLPPSQLIYWPNEDGSHQLFWSPPEDLNTACSLWAARLPGYSFLNRERWIYVGSTLNTSPTRLIDNPFLIDVPIVFRARTLSPYGTTSFFPPRIRIEPRVLSYFDRCEILDARFSGNWALFEMSSDKIEGNFAYHMVFSGEPGEVVEFQYIFDPPLDWSDYKTLNFLMRSIAALDPSAAPRLIISSLRNGNTITETYSFTLATNVWKYLSFELPMPSIVPGSFNIEAVSKVMIRITHAYPEGETSDILFDHVHLDAGVSDYVPPPPPPPPSGWDLSTAVYDDINFGVSGESTAPTGGFFSPDGSIMYVLDLDLHTVFQYSLSSPWDISTASYTGNKFQTGAEAVSPYGIFFKPDGTKMYILEITTMSVYQYSLVTPWDISTASYDSVSFSVAGQVAAGYDLFFNDGGSKMYVVDVTSTKVFQYTLSTPWDISTASYDSIFVNVGGQATYPHGLFFKPDGTKMYIVDYDSLNVYQYTLSTPWVVSSAIYDSVSFSVATQAPQPYGLFFKVVGTKMYILDADTLAVYQYSLS